MHNLVTNDPPMATCELSTVGTYKNILATISLSKTTKNKKLCKNCIIVYLDAFPRRDT